MTPEGSAILEYLREVAHQRHIRAQTPALEAGTRAVKDFQHRRFAKTYADLMSTPRYGRAATFFLDHLYGPHDFTERDAQFARVVPGLVRLFPNEIVVTVKALAELHALSERLDTLMARALPGTDLDASRYIEIWQATGHAADRERQIALMLEVGFALERFTRNPLLRHSLRLMRGPAKAAGLGALQSFLESGFDTFREMRGGADFLRTVAERERHLAKALFDAGLVAGATDPSALLGQLP